MAIDPSWIAAGSKVLASAVQPSPVVTTSAGQFDARFDGAGWTVSTGSSRADGANVSREESSAGPFSQLGGLTGLAVVAMLAIVLLRRA